MRLFAIAVVAVICGLVGTCTYYNVEENKRPWDTTEVLILGKISSHQSGLIHGSTYRKVMVRFPDGLERLMYASEEAYAKAKEGEKLMIDFRFSTPQTGSIRLPG